MVFTLENGVLKRAIGTHLPNSAATAVGEEPLSALSALSAFLNTIREGPWAPPSLICIFATSFRALPLP